jgi:hypothetical protein
VQVPLLAILLVLLLPLLFVLLLPVSLLQRYRMGTARRPARGWLATLNVVAIGLSSLLFLLGAAVTSVWVPRALTFALLGLAAGVLLGALGLLVSRWEHGPGTLHYTPNRWLVLAITLLVAARIGWSFARAWNAWQAGASATGWLAAAGVAGSLGVGAVVLGYYLAYWLGVRRRFRRHLGR